MTSTTDRNDLMPPQEKLEWVTPKISLMEAGDTDAKTIRRTFEVVYGFAFFGSFLISLFWSFLIDFNIKPRHTYKNQSSQRVYKDPFLVCSGHLRHWLPGTVAADFGLGGRVKDATDVLLASR